MMRNALKALLLAAALLGQGASAGGFTLSMDNYSAKVAVQQPKGNPKDIVVISLHGKGRGNRHPGNVSFARELRKAGYTVYLPQMPWPGYEASLPVAFEFLDALVEKATPNGERVVISGHSQGATFGFLYTVAHDPPPSVVGTVILSPGHMIHRSRKMQDATAGSVLTARKLIKEGQGDEKASFTDMNMGKSFSVRTTPNIYVTYFDLGVTPNFLFSLREARLPLLWVNGETDYLSDRYDYELFYRKYFPAEPRSRFTTVSGDHVTMWFKAHKPVLEWLERLESEDSPAQRR